MSTLAETAFSGSYAPTDVQFLLSQLDIEPIADVEEKEALIQSGARHYSEMIGKELLPPADYFDHFHSAVEANKARVAKDVLRLARSLVRRRGNDITLVSLARAGTPFGVLLKRALSEFFGVTAAHYSVSIIRDRGIDTNAIKHILTSHRAESVAFIDGWSGKGAIRRELSRTLAEFNSREGTQLADELFVAVDLAGVATEAGSGDDYLIPSAILNAPVSGLVSRTILNESVGPSDFHGCLYYDEWESVDQSRSYIEAIAEAMRSISDPGQPMSEPDRLQRQMHMQRMVASLMGELAITNDNLVKPGIGEATRAVLRRAPEKVLICDPSDPELSPLLSLCKARGVPVIVRKSMPVKATAIIRKLGDV